MFLNFQFTTFEIASLFKKKVFPDLIYIKINKN